MLLSHDMPSSITLSNVLIEVPEKEQTIDLDSDFSLDSFDTRSSSPKRIVEKRDEVCAQQNDKVRTTLKDNQE